MLQKSKSLEAQQLSTRTSLKVELVFNASASIFTSSSLFTAARIINTALNTLFTFKALTIRSQQFGVSDQAICNFVITLFDLSPSRIHFILSRVKFFGFSKYIH